MFVTRCSEFRISLWDILLSIFWFMLLFAWIWMLITILADIFRDHDLPGWRKAMWTLFSSSSHGWVRWFTWSRVDGR